MTTFGDMVYHMGGVPAGLGTIIPTNNVFWVDSNTGNDSNTGKKRSAPMATISAAIAKCTAAKGDVIFVFPNHAEVVTTSITVNVAGVYIIGLGTGRHRPALTTTTATDVVTVTADNVTLANLHFGVPGIDAVTADINIAAANCHVLNTTHLGSTTSMNKVDIITLTAAAHDAYLDGVTIWNDTVEVVGGIVLEGAAKRVKIYNCKVLDSIGFTNGALSDEATALQLEVFNCYFQNAKAATVVVEFGNNTTGVCRFMHVAGGHTTIASNITAGTGMRFFETRVNEEAALNGMIMPAADAE